MNKNKIVKTIFALGIYAIAIALVEAAVVIYLRELYYPGGVWIKSAADVAVIPQKILNVELWREAATIFMLAAVGYLAFDTAKKRFWSFIFVFSVWDLFYYFFLYIFLGWPQSLGTLDLYYFIPWPWIGPVWIPLILFTILGIISFKLLTKNK